MKTKQTLRNEMMLNRQNVNIEIRKMLQVFSLFIITIFDDELIKCYYYLSASDIDGSMYTTHSFRKKSVDHFLGNNNEPKRAPTINISDSIRLYRRREEIKNKYKQK